MAKTRLLQAVCTVAMLAAAPAFAQNSGAGMTGQNGAPNPAAQQGTSGTADSATSQSGAGGSMAPANSADTGSSTSATNPHMRHSATHSRGNAAGDEAVDRLNEQSYQAAQKGQPFSVGGSDSGSGAMSGPSGGSMQNNGSGAGTK